MRLSRKGRHRARLLQQIEAMAASPLPHTSTLALEVEEPPPLGEIPPYPGTGGMGVEASLQRLGRVWRAAGIDISLQRERVRGEVVAAYTSPLLLPNGMALSPLPIDEEEGRGRRTLAEG